jgi:tetratricopeptide (TPR) repeat protein
MVLAELGQVKEALAVCQSAERLRPDPATPYFRTGQVLVEHNKTLDAQPFLRMAARFAPENRNVRLAYATALHENAEYAAAMAELSTAIELPRAPAPPNGNEERLAEFDRAVIARCRALLGQSQKLAALDVRLPTVLSGADNPAPRERCEMALICVHRKRWRDATRLYSEAMAAEPRLAEAVNSVRYNAACAAVLGAADTSEERPDEAESARLRGQALAWLRADFENIRKKIDSQAYGDRAEAARLLRHWQSDSDLASVRDETSRNRLPAAERDAWTSLWAEVDAALKAAAEE